LRIGPKFRAIAATHTYGGTYQISDGSRVEGIKLFSFAPDKACWARKPGMKVHRCAAPGQARHARLSSPCWGVRLESDWRRRNEINVKFTIRFIFSLSSPAGSILPPAADSDGSKIKLVGKWF
jgi:hypothetical protein